MDVRAVVRPFVRRWRRWPFPTAVRDTVVVALMGLVALWVSPVETGTGQGWLTHTVVLLACTPLLLRRRFPVTVALATGVLVFVSYAAVGHDGSLFAAVFAMASAAHRRPRAVPVLTAVSLVWWIAYPVVLSPGDNPLVLWSGDLSDPAVSVHGGLPDFALAALVALVPVLAGYMWRLRADRLAGIRREAYAAFERERLQERERIAREVHDIAGHHLSAIRLLAVGGGQALEGRDPEAVAVLGTVAELSGRAVREVRELLDSLRGDRSIRARTDRGVADLPSLAETLERTGVGVDLVVPESVREGLSEQVGANVYRLVQESLGNVLRHSSARRVRVELACSVGVLTVTVEDDGWRGEQAGQGADGLGGQGLAGMRERVEELGGVLEAGHGPVRGWRVRAVLPLERVLSVGALRPEAPVDARAPENAKGCG